MLVSESLTPGDRVKVFNLKSEAGQALNGSYGIVEGFDVSSGRYQVSLEGQGCRAFKPENLCFAENAFSVDVAANQRPEDVEASERFLPGDHVEVHTLRSESGQLLNGCAGIVQCWDPSSGRYQVDLDAHGRRALRSENLRPKASSETTVAPSSMSAPEALTILSHALDSTNTCDDRKFEALRSIRDVGVAAKILEPQVVQCLHNVNWKIRGAAIEALSGIDCVKAHGTLIETLLKDINGDVRFAAVEALGRGAAAVHVDALALALRDTDDGVRMAAAVALGKAGVPAARPYVGVLVELLGETTEQLRLAGANSLAKFGDAVVPHLEELMAACENDTSKEVCLAAALAVAQAGEAADPYEERVGKVLERLS